jgi:hypothetical protein
MGVSACGLVLKYGPYCATLCAKTTIMCTLNILTCVIISYVWLQLAAQSNSSTAELRKWSQTSSQKPCLRGRQRHSLHHLACIACAGVWCKIIPLGHGQYVYNTANFTYYLVYRMYYCMSYYFAMIYSMHVTQSTVFSF